MSCIEIILSSSGCYFEILWVKRLGVINNSSKSSIFHFLNNKLKHKARNINNENGKGSNFCTFIYKSLKFTIKNNKNKNTKKH